MATAGVTGASPREGNVNAAVAPNKQHNMNGRRMVSSFALHAAMATKRAKGVGNTYCTGKRRELTNRTATSSSKKPSIPALAASTRLHLVRKPKAKVSKRMAVSSAEIYM